MVSPHSASGSMSPPMSPGDQAILLEATSPVTDAERHQFRQAHLQNSFV
jgi:hypothetical protein